jgi:hypothetical protein
MKAKSFICEHSVEFVLVSFLTKLFSNHKQNIVPLYFWKSREGSSMSIRCGPNKPIRLLAMYARRPKVSEPEQDHILVKINGRLFERAYYLKENGIPTVVGVPRVSSIMDLYIGCPCSWFMLCPDKDCTQDVEFNIDIKSNKCYIKLPAEVRGPLDDVELISLFTKGKYIQSWHDAIEIMRSERLDHMYRRDLLYWGMSIYKPVYFISQ